MEWIFIGILVVIIVVLLLKDSRRNQEIAELAEELAEVQLADKVQQARKEAVEKSNQIVKGKVLEQFAPYFATFPYHPQDARFLGSPIDFVVFDGLTEGEIRQIVFVEVKTGNMDRKLPKREQQVKDCIAQGKVSWVFVQHPQLNEADYAYPQKLMKTSISTKLWGKVKSILGGKIDKA
ncbi:MAG: Holliday junction resolvase-like protein [Thermoflexibacteraceae bacterium]|jgi:predicted Holliday junction resolvase-like endonuclease